MKGRLDCEHDTDAVVHIISDSEAQTINNAVAVGDFLASPAPADCSFKHVFHFRSPEDLAQMGQCIKSLLDLKRMIELPNVCIKRTSVNEG